MISIPRRLSLSLLISALGVASPPAWSADADILACAAREKEAIAPTDILNCQWKNGIFDATLVQIYSEGWRIVETAFFDGTRQVIYLEKPVTPAS